LIVRKLKGLEKVIEVSIVDYLMGEGGKKLWIFFLNPRLKDGNLVAPKRHQAVFPIRIIISNS
jgi:glutathionyl-hydroquinone reductase